VTIEVPDSFKALSDDLLVHGDWAKLPPPTPNWTARQFRTVVSFVEGEKWTQWTINDWLLALTILSCSIAVVHQCVELGRALRARPA
jgi:hypothetical protein